MTLNCDLDIETAREEFAKAQTDGSARDLLESAFEYWQVDHLADAALAIELRKIAAYLEAKPKTE